MTTMTINAVANWFGSNRKLAKNVGAVMGPRNWVGVACAGGMCEIPHIQARSIVANDLHRHVINLAWVIGSRHLGPQLYRRLRRRIFHPDELAVVKPRLIFREQNPVTYRMPDLDWAEDYFIVAWLGRAGTAGARDEFQNPLSTRWNASGGDSAVRFNSAINSLPAWRRSLRSTTFTVMDAMAFLAKCKDMPMNGIYVDFPFPGPGDRYKYKIDEAYHRAAAIKLASFREARVVMRFYDVPLIREIYPESLWKWTHYKGRTQANEEAPEVLLVRN